MDPIEQRIRASLRARAEDAEPTAHLYRGVQGRIARRRRKRLLAWVPAGAAALGVAVAVPMLLTSGPQVPDIEDYADEQTASASAPDRAVVLDRTGELAVLDLTDGSSIQPYDGLRIGGSLPEIDVAPSDRSDVPGVHTATPKDRTGGATLALGYRAEGRTGTVDGGSSAAEGGFTVSPDGRWVATLSSAVEDADGWVLQIRPSPGADSHEGGELFEPSAIVPAGSVVQEWAGPPVRARGPASVVTILSPDGQLLGIPLSPASLEGTDEIVEFGWIGERLELPVGDREVAAYASSHLGDETGFVLETVGERTVVQAVDGEEVLGQVDVSDLVGHQDPATFALDAWGDTAALSTPDGSWLLPHDGEGNFAERVALPEGTVRAALVGEDTGEVPTEDPEPPAEEATDDGDVVVEEPAGEDLGDGLVVADDTTVTLVRPDGSTQELVTFPTEGGSTVVDVAVRPGSRTDDLTLALTTRAEGAFDVRWLRVRGGEVDTTTDPVGTAFPARPIERDGRAVFTSPDLQDGGEPAAVWSPDGDLLAVVRRPAIGAPNQVRTIGWDDDGPSGEPNRAVDLELATDRPLTPRQWVWSGGEGADRQGQLLLVDDLAREAFTVRLDRQGDGAPAVPADNPLVPVAGAGVLDLADRDGEGTVDAVLRVSDPFPNLELADGSVVHLEATGPRHVSFLAASEQLILVVLDPAQPMLVDRESGELIPAPIDGEVVSADLIG